MIARSGPGPESTPGPDPGAQLLALYDEAVADVYGYLYRRCSSAPLAEDLTSETFLAAAAAVARGRAPSPFTVGWLIAVARNKLVDHWRRAEREQRVLTVLSDDGLPADDTWDAVLDGTVALDALARLGPHHRSALTLHYLDGLTVPETAHCLQRSVGATEVLLVRARRAFRHVYESIGAGEEER
ncbi:MAG: RNA polymerase sigma factor [Acidimicrobiia bacterium]|nr:RNA polymerase sigma factor [Acidimicrobiia bacterium]